MSLERLIAQEGGVYPDHGGRDRYRSKDRVYWCGARGLLHNIEDTDGRVQRRDGLTLALWWLGVVCHG